MNLCILVQSIFIVCTYHIDFFGSKVHLWPLHDICHSEVIENYLQFAGCVQECQS